MTGRACVSRRAALALGAACVLPLRGALADDPAADLLRRIAAARLPVRTLRGSFTQTRTIGLLATDVRSKGTLALVRPNRLRWELSPPDDVTFWIGPEGLAYRGAHGEGRLAAGAGHLSDALQDLHSLLGGDLADLERRWSVRVLRDDATGADVEATSRAPAAEAPRAMRLALAPDLVRPMHALLVEGPRDRTTIDFGDVVINAPVDERAMRPP